MSLFKFSRGFTLAELLVVITILAALTLIGFSTYSNFQKSVRDSRRKQDIEEITKALESSKILSGYVVPGGSMFQSGNLPYDPKQVNYRDVPTSGGFPPQGCGDTSQGVDKWKSGCWYCLRQDSSETYCDSTSPWIDQANQYPKTSFIVCANLETGIGYYCKKNQQ